MRLPPTEGDSNLLELENDGILGRGNEGIVYKALHRKSHSYYALKVPYKAHDSSPIAREMKILRKTDCPYVVKCQGISSKEENINFVLEYMDGGSLADLLKEKRGLPESFIAKVARQGLEGLKYLQSQGIVHRDIKPSNILISKNHKRIKIGDFGVSRFVSPTTPSCESSVGTYAYMSPERFDSETHGGRYNGYAGDIWGLGLTLLECFLGHSHFLGLKSGRICMPLLCKNHPPRPAVHLQSSRVLSDVVLKRTQARDRRPRSFLNIHSLPKLHNSIASFLRLHLLIGLGSVDAIVCRPFG